MAPAERRQRGQARKREGPFRLDREDEQTLVLELAPQARLIVGDVDAFDDLPVRRSQPALELHDVSFWRLADLIGRRA